MFRAARWLSVKSAAAVKDSDSSALPQPNAAEARASP